LRGLRMVKRYKGKTALVYDNGLFVEAAITLAKDFDKIYYYCPWTSGYPNSNPLWIGKGIAGVQRIPSIWDVVDEVDLWVFPDVYDGPLQDHLVQMGKRVWGSRHGEVLELNRHASKQLQEELGISIGHYKVVTGLAALRTYLREHEDQYVKISATRGDMETFYSKNYKLIEPRLNELAHRLGAKANKVEFIVEDAINDAVEVGYDGFSIDGQFPSHTLYGIEIKDRGYIGRVKAYDDLPEQIRDVNHRFSPILQTYNYRNFWSAELRITKDGTAYSIDPCFSEDTEVLTAVGWKLFADLSPADTVCTMDPKTGVIEYQQPTDYIAHPYKGDMVLISNKEKGIECLVTPNHNVWRTDRHGNGLFCQRADSLTDRGYIPRTGTWVGRNSTHFTLPEYSNEWLSGRWAYRGEGSAVRKAKYCPAVDIDMEAWLRFLAVFLGDGSVRSDWSLSVTQTDASPNKDAVEEVLRALPFTVSRYAGGFAVSSVQLVDHFSDRALCHEKRVPSYVKELSPRLIDIFLDAYRLCDGSGGKQSLYFTTSKGLADDLQELVFKAGRLANIYKKDNKGTFLTINGKSYSRNHDLYIVAERAQQTRFWFEATTGRSHRYISHVPYDGMVYDVTVPNHTLYVRRNGKPFWSSNCARFGSPPSELFGLMMSNFAEVLWEGADGNLVEPEYKGEWAAELLIHSTWAGERNWQAVEFPEEIRDNVKLRNLSIVDGKYYVVPDPAGMPEIGAVVVYGDSQDDVVKKCRKVAEQVEGYLIQLYPDALDDAQSEIKQLEDFGIDF
jgi:hypothetical protein